MEDVEMAQDEVELAPLFPPRTRSGTTDARIQIFAGPGMSESVPTSVSAFSHRRRERADSSASLMSFAYYDEAQDSEGEDEEAILDLDEDEADYNGYTAEELEDMEAGLRDTSSA